MKKLPTELSNEELLNNLDSTEDISIVENDVGKFISFYNIKSGNDKVLSGLLYHLYKNWSKNRTTRHSFSKELGLYFEKSNSAFLLNKDSINFSQKALELLNSPKKNKFRSSQKHFNSFIKCYDIKKDGYWIEDSIFYAWYIKWCSGNSRKRHLSFSNFNKFCTLYFEKRVNYSENFSWYNINNNILNFITLEQMEKIRMAKDGKKENKKRRKKISSD